ncbi:rhodanese-like domain-containing protein [Streptomyces achromogenes]|jgi:rhodanese-related sulfurtransferase|uniref:Rhodanese-like domain-containing protein n=1 Tax=Streptomyces achromogenes TaxID=67255 RepID=A0ABZ1KH60_STRAH|nr:rhodanese-like domain-containing protein [Streptomyces achromogenes]MCZ0204279.1 rhodanese-like domain-containing protein [Streptomyces sp. UMAF16]
MVQRITRDELKKKIDEGLVTVVEALPAQYYNDKHLPGALNLPHDQVDQLAPSLLPDKEAEVVVYCANEPCPNSGIAAGRLAELGYVNVREYGEGKEDWVGAGLPTESGA